LLLLVLLCGYCCCAAKWRPVVLMHGLLSSPGALSATQRWIEDDFPGIYVLNMQIGNGKMDSMTTEMNTQVATFAKKVRDDPNLQAGFNIIGHSQGGLITRAYVERYNNPPVYNLISWAGPQGGVFGVPEFNGLCPDHDCPGLNDLLDILINQKRPTQWLQDHFTFASYWKDPFNYADFLIYNTFLADINNERQIKNETYRKNILSLNSYLLVYSTDDTVVIPKESPWFYFYANNSDTQIVPLQKSNQYLYDWVGLHTLDDQQKLLLQHVPCNHHNIPQASCHQYYVLYTQQLLNNTL